MRLPLNKIFSFNQSPTAFLDNYSEKSEIPLAPHPGSFGFVRKNHIHEGIDLYCEEGDEVVAIEDSVVLNIYNFTGEWAVPASAWWENTQAVLLQSAHYTYNYGEIIACESLKIGDKLQEGQVLGHVKTVLKKDKGRPRTMLHLELYDKTVIKAIDAWQLNTPKPSGLLDPTPLLIQCLPQNKHEIERLGIKKIKF